MKHAIKIGLTEDVVGINKLTPKKVEKAARFLFVSSGKSFVDKFSFKMTGDYGALLYRNDEDSKEQIKVYFHKLYSLD